MSRKTIVFCCNTLWGLVNFRGRVIRTLAEAGHRVVLVAPRDKTLSQVAALGAEFVDWDVAPRSTNPWQEALAVWRLARIFRRLRPDLAFQFTIKPVMYGALVASITGTPLIAVVTGLGYLFVAGRRRLAAAKALYRLTLRRAREVWFLNADDRRVFEEAGLTGGLCVRTLPGEGVDIDHFGEAPLPPVGNEADFVFLMISRLLKDKGVAEYAEAARLVRSRHPRARFKLLGPPYEGNGASVPLATVDAWSREGRIDYLGAADDVRPAIAQSHCIVLPSYREGMPRVLMEAAAMGRPAVATDVPGCRDVVASGRTGLLCRAQDAGDLARACEDMLERSPPAIAGMARDARAQAVERFDDRIVIDIYRSVVEALPNR
jgi:glycosyltransferase involved in cell wall biosynthesis